MLARHWGGVLLAGLLAIDAEAREYHYSDAHLHYVDFFQESEGMPALLEAMDKARIDSVSYTHL